MLGNITIGDLVLDPRRLLFVKSLKALVCVGLFESERVGELTDVISDALEYYKAESLILVGPVTNTAGLVAFQQAYQEEAPVHLVTSTKEDELRQLAEQYGMEWHQELVWAKYRFVESLELGAIEMYFVSAIGGYRSEEQSQCFALKVGKMGFGGRKMPVFLKGLGQMILPSISEVSPVSSVFSEVLNRYDTFAVGNTRVFPLGRVSELAPVRTFGTVPLSVIHEEGRKKILKTKKKATSSVVDSSKAAKR